MRRVSLFLMLATLLLPACGGGSGGTVVVSDLPALGAYLIGVLQAETALAAEASPILTSTGGAAADDLAQGAEAAYSAFAAAIAGLSPPPEAKANQRNLIALAEDGAEISARLGGAAEAMDLRELTSIAVDTLELSIRSVDEVAERQNLIGAVLAAHPDRPMNRYLIAIADLWVPLTADYHRLTGKVQRSLLDGRVSGAVGPCEELLGRFDEFLPKWEAITPPPDAAEFHQWYREWAAEGLDIVGGLLANLRSQNLTGLPGSMRRVTAWAEGWSQAIQLRNQITIAALEQP
ncbi:MAG: hypothetical protein FJW79_06850 [Actinobacteria bacterium]|nr:hypothetical protein [Actinomycetota bacterium]